MQRILFVDDEPAILAGLRQLLRKQRNEWSMQFVEGGTAAIELLDRESFDVVVSDMRMPKVDGVAVLRYVKERHPETVRIVLSGYSTHEDSLKVLPIAHHFLSKPCRVDTLKTVIIRACGLKSLFAGEELHRIVGSMESLSTAPETYMKLMQAIANQNSSARELAGIVESDPALMAKVLQVANSAFFGLPQATYQIDKAISSLSINMLRHIVLGLEVFSKVDSTNKIDGFSVEIVQQEALAVGALAKKILASEGHVAEEAMLGGMLHDVGQLVLATHKPERLRETLEIANREQICIYQAEHDHFSVGHAEIGAYLLGIWGLPYPVVEAVAYHHCPSRVPELKMGPLVAVHLADAILSAQRRGSPTLERSELDWNCIESLELEPKLEQWQVLAQKSL